MIVDSHLQTVADVGVNLLRHRLPAGWTVQTPGPDAVGRPRIADEVWLDAPGRRRVRVRVHVVRELLASHLGALRASAGRDESPALVIAPSLSRETRHTLTTLGINWVDLRGDIRFCLQRPAVSIDVRRIPAPPSRQARRARLSGAKTARVVRTLCDFRTPTDCASVGLHADVSTAHATRIVRALAGEGLVVMTGSHTIESADWAALLRRWSDDDRARATQFTWYCAPRGIGSLTSRLKHRQDCVLSGPWAANVFAPLASTQVLVCYVSDARRFAEQHDLALADTTANVALSSRFPDALLKGTSEYGEIRIAALSQIAADLLTLSLESTARPVLEWMRDNEPAWRR